MKKYTGYTAQEFMDNEDLLLEIVHPDDKESFTNHMIHEKLNSCAETFEFRVIDKNGDVRRLSHTCQPLYDHDGNFLGRRDSSGKS